MKLAQLRVRTMAPHREPLVKSTNLQWTGTTLSVSVTAIRIQSVKKKTIHFKYFLKFSGDSKYERNQ